MEWTRRVTGNLWQSQFHTVIRYPDIPDPVVIIWRAYMRIDYNDIDLENATVWSKIPLGLKSPNIRSLMWELRKTRQLFGDGKENPRKPFG